MQRKGQTCINDHLSTGVSFQFCEKKQIIFVLYYISVICKNNKSVTAYYRFPDPIVAIIKTLFKKKLPQASIYVLLRENWSLEKYDVRAVMVQENHKHFFSKFFQKILVAVLCRGFASRSRSRFYLRPQGGVCPNFYQRNSS